MRVIVLLILCIANPATAMKIRPIQSSRVEKVSLCDDGTIMAWTTYKSVFLSRSARPDMVDSTSLPQQGDNPVSEIKLSGDGSCFFLVRGDNTVYRGSTNIANTLLLTRLDSCKLRPFWLDVNYDGTMVSGLLEGTDSATCKPAWDAVSTIHFYKNAGVWKQSKPLTPTEECSLIRRPSLDNTGAVIFSIDNINSIFQIPSPPEKNFPVDIGLNGYELGDYPISKDGKSLLIYRNRKMNSYKDSVKSLFLSEKHGGVWSQPYTLLPEHKDPILWHSCISPDGNHICWMHLFRGADGNTIVKQQVYIIHRTATGWTKPEPLFTIPNVQVWDLVMSNTNILLTTINDLDVYYFSKLDNSGDLFHIGGQGTSKISSGELTVFDGDPEKH